MAAPVLFDQRPLTKGEAMVKVKQIRYAIDGIRSMVLEFEERLGWKALGYNSWRECVVAEFEKSGTHLYRQLTAAKIERVIAPDQPIGIIPERHIRPLQQLPEDERKDAWEEAVETAPNGHVTGDHVLAVVESRLDRQPGDDDDLSEIAPDSFAPSGFVTSEIIEPPGPDDFVIDVEPHEDAADGLESDDAWLLTLPIRSRLDGAILRGFDKDALRYRRMEDARKDFAAIVARVLGTKTDARRDGPWAYRVRRFLKLDHPRHWLVCPSTDEGGCNGTGTIPLLGDCPKCFGKGYWIR